MEAMQSGGALHTWQVDTATGTVYTTVGRLVLAATGSRVVCCAATTVGESTSSISVCCKRHG